MKDGIRGIMRNISRDIRNGSLLRPFADALRERIENAVNVPAVKILADIFSSARHVIKVKYVPALCAEEIIGTRRDCGAALVRKPFIYFFSDQLMRIRRRHINFSPRKQPSGLFRLLLYTFSGNFVPLRAKISKKGRLHGMIGRKKLRRKKFKIIAKNACLFPRILI